MRQDLKNLMKKGHYKEMGMNPVKYLLFLLLPLFLANARYPQEKINSISEGRTWHKLLHYKKGLMGAYESLLDGPGFFLAKDGKHNPAAELKATLEAFGQSALRVGREKQHPRCAFPLRYKFLGKHFAIADPKVSCEKLETFLGKFDRRAVFLIFSSAYPNNPGSMFGHTLLRIGNAKQKASFMLDHGINYAAVVPPDLGGVVFAVKGIFGGYLGQFSLLPYYAKLAQYNDVENRDIWEYRLDLSPEEVDDLLLHIWEIETNSYFDYYFFDENCSYHILSLLEVARPGLELTDHFLYMTPPGSIKRVIRVPGLVKSIHFRPSLLKKLSHSYNRLNKSRKDLFSKITDGEGIEEVVDGEVLDSAIIFLNYQKRGKKFNDKKRKILGRLLLRRSGLPATKSKPPIKPPRISNRPDIGHDPHLLTLGGGTFHHNSFWELGYQSAWHDLLANDNGYERFSELVFPAITLRGQNSKIFLEELNIVRITSFAPWGRFDRKMSWSLKFNLTQNRTSPPCRSRPCLVGTFHTGSGLATHLFNENFLVSAMLLAHGEAGKKLNKGYHLGPKISAFFLANPLDWYKSKISYSEFFHAKQNWRKRRLFEWGHAFFIDQNMEIRLFLSTTAEKKEHFHSAKIELLYYSI